MKIILKKKERKEYERERNRSRAGRPSASFFRFLSAVDAFVSVVRVFLLYRVFTEFRLCFLALVPAIMADMFDMFLAESCSIPRVSIASICYYLVRVICACFYRVLPSFTEFHRVFLLQRHDSLRSATRIEFELNYGFWPRFT